MRNRESILIRNALSRFASTAKVLTVAFCVGALLFTVVGLITVVSLFAGEAITPEMVVGAIGALVQDAVVVATFVLCALVARDVSRSEIPFTRTQFLRIRAVAWIMLAYFVFCAAWDPLIVPVALTGSPLSVNIVPESEPSGIRINIEAFLASCAFFLFSFILDYGRTLQQLSDESM